MILIGEIRDEETAEIAVRAAQVGRLVLSTLHTNSAAGAVTRLVDLGGAGVFGARCFARRAGAGVAGHPLPGLQRGGLCCMRRGGGGGAALGGGVVGGVRGCPESGHYFCCFISIG
nr:ATPase, T2SS/T4P/T4SS family [Tabrizicola oligotrophica]